IIVDITEQKERELQRALQQERMGLAVGAAGIGTWEVDLVAGTSTWSDQLRTIFGLALDAPAPDPNAIAEFVVDDDRAAAVRAIRAEIPPHGRFAEHEFRIRRPDGEVRHVLTRRAAQYDAGGRA